MTLPGRWRRHLARRLDAAPGSNPSAGVPVTRVVAGSAALALLVLVMAVVRQAVLGRPGMPWVAGGWWIAGIVACILALGLLLHRRASAVVGVVPMLAASLALVLGLAAYGRCRPSVDGWFSPLYWTLSLFTANVATPFGDVKGGCPTDPPVALMAARLLAIAATLWGIVQVVLRLLGGQLDRLFVRASSRRVVLLGVGADAVELVAALAQRKLPVQTVVAEVADDAVALRVRRLGVRVVSPRGERDLALLMTQRGNLAADDVWVLDADPARSIATARVVAELLSGVHVAARRPVRLLVRIEDPWAAESWRREQLARGNPWLSDAVSALAETARAVVAASRHDDARPVVLVGEGDLCLSLLAEFAQRQTQRAALDAGAASLPDAGGAIHLVNPRATEVLADAQRVWRRWSGDFPDVVAHDEVPGVEQLAGLLGEAPSAAVVFTDADGRSRRLASSLALAREGVDVFALDAGNQPLDRPLTGRLHLFGLSLVDARGEPVEDFWTRLAHLMHNQYLAGRPAGSVVTRASQRPWASLPHFYRDSNVRRIGVLMHTVPSLDRTWRNPDGVPEPFSEDERDRLARAEHDSWREHYRQNGWRQAQRRRDDVLEHDQLGGWDSLDAETQAYNRSAVGDLERLLAVAGYRSRRRPWATWRRTGEVQAVRLQADRAWQTPSGDHLMARAGDWWVMDAAGQGRSVRPDVFAASYAHVGGDRYARRGVVRACEAEPGEVVASLEGDEVARAGQWLVEGSKGERWLVDADRFHATYERVDD